jgi:hypothetical protein
MKPIILNADYMIPPNEIPDVEIPTEIHFTRFGTNEIPNGEPNFIDTNSYKIFCHVNEPTTSRWVEPVDNIIKHHKAYDKIVTSNNTVLQNCSNAVFMPYGTTWLNKSKHHPDAFGKFTEDLGQIKKEFSLSMVCGSLFGKPGYNLRHAIFQHQDSIKVPKKFYSSTRFVIPNVPTLPNDDKINLFDSMYSVSVESSQETNYFSEKLVDCLITKTIPIYWGCPNISDFFDSSYWIKVENLLSFNFTEQYYYDNLDKINQNFEKTKIYCDNIFKRILEIK